MQVEYQSFIVRLAVLEHAVVRGVIVDSETGASKSFSSLSELPGLLLGAVEDRALEGAPAPTENLRAPPAGD